MNRRHARLVLIGGGILVLYGVVAFLLLLPPIESPPSRPVTSVTPAQCADVGLTAHLAEQQIILFTPLPHVPEPLIAALLRQEDGFYHHRGVDWTQAARAAIKNLRGGRIEFGASTLTMQLMRELFLDKRRTYLRKLREMAYALQVERRLRKSEILELYLNTVHWGPGIRGVGLATCYYFGVFPNGIDAAQATALVRLLPNPDVRGRPLRAARTQSQP